MDNPSVYIAFWTLQLENIQLYKLKAWEFNKQHFLIFIFLNFVIYCREQNYALSDAKKTIMGNCKMPKLETSSFQLKNNYFNHKSINKYAGKFKPNLRDKV